MVQTKQELIRIIKDYQPQMKDLGVKSLGLFGSFVTNKAKQDSDVDLLVEFEPSKKTFRNFIALCNLAEQITGREVEIITRQSLSKFLAPHILSETEYVF